MQQWPDFDSDGKLDLAVANSGGVALLLGKGNGAFQSPVNYTVGSNPAGLAIADLNGDGKTDVAGTSSAGVSVLLGKGNGTFESAISSPAGSSPHAVAVGD